MFADLRMGRTSAGWIGFALLAALVLGRAVPAQPAKTHGSGEERAGLPMNLAKAAEQTKNEAVRSLYRRLAVAHDEVNVPLPGASFWIEPIPLCLNGRGALPDDLSVLRISTQGKFIDKKSWRRGEVVEIQPYEAVAVAQVEEFLKKLPKTGAAVPDLLLAAEQALVEVLRFHKTALERRQRTGPGWDRLGQDLEASLRDVRLRQLRSLAETQPGAAALARAQQLATTYPQARDVRSGVIDVYVQEAERLLKDDQHDKTVQARLLLEQLERQFPGSQEDRTTLPVRQRLQTKARWHVTQADGLTAKNRLQAIEQLNLAEAIWPALPELRQRRQTLGLDTVLYVGVPQLPTLLSPATAATESERQALELLFESLVRPVLQPSTGQEYEAVLAAGPPRLLSHGRQFQLASNARWYRPEYGNLPLVNREVDAADVRRTVELFQQASQEGRGAPQWRELLAGARTVEGDPFSVRLTLQQGCFDPLALMTFKILPAQLNALDDPDFARHPVGSGPYTYAREKRTIKAGEPAVPCAVFRANPTYASRAGKSGRPIIREVCFVSMQGRDARQDFQSGKDDPRHLHLWLDVPTRQVKELAKLERVRVQTLRARRAYFLAVNHRLPMFQSESLRRALALALDRDQILDAAFRDPEGGGRNVHRPLNSLYLPNTWASDPKLPANPFDADLARKLAAQAKQGGVLPALDLRYPADLPQVKEACAQIRLQVQERTGIVINLKPNTTTELHRAVVLDHDYQLAYWGWDYPDEAYSLWPLFDPASANRGGSNILGPVNDSKLEDFFRQSIAHRAFPEVQRWTQLIHKRLYDTMPVIPLWQLDVHLALHQEVKTVPAPERLDPLRVFTHAEQWRLAK